MHTLNYPEAQLAAVNADLLVRSTQPLNCETPLPALTGDLVVPNARFYIRNHFGIPRLDPASWRLNVGGLVHRRLSLDLDRAGALVAVIGACQGIPIQPRERPRTALRSQCVIVISNDGARITP